MRFAICMFVGWGITLGCRSDKDSQDEADTTDWWETEADAEGGTSSDGSSDDGDKPDDGSSDDGDKPETGYQECGEDFDSTESCEGTWETTLCTYDGLVWWCENGVWLNEEDK